MHRRGRRSEESGQRGDVVEVPVREKNGGEFRPGVPKRRENPRSILSRIDDRRLAGPVENEIRIFLVCPGHDALDFHVRRV